MDIKLKAEIKISSKAYDELCDAFCELNDATENMPWLNDYKERMIEAIKETRIENGEALRI